MYMTAIPELTITRATATYLQLGSLRAQRPSWMSLDTQRAAYKTDFLDNLAESVTYAKNRTIYCEGDASQSCFRVISGMVRLCKVTEDGRRQIAAFHTPGDIFGWADQGPRRYSAEAVTDVVVERYLRDRFDRLLALHSAEASRLLRSIATQLASAQEHMLVLGRLTATERLAALLWDLARRQGVGASAEPVTVIVPMSRKDIADYLGLTIETVSRTMSALRCRGAISFKTTREVRVNDLALLERHASAAPPSATLESI